MEHLQWLLLWVDFLNSPQNKTNKQSHELQAFAL